MELLLKMAMISTPYQQLLVYLTSNLYHQLLYQLPFRLKVRQFLHTVLSNFIYMILPIITQDQRSTANLKHRFLKVFMILLAIANMSSYHLLDIIDLKSKVLTKEHLI